MKKFKYMMVVSVALVLSSASAFAEGGTGQSNKPVCPDAGPEVCAAKNPALGQTVVPCPGQKSEGGAVKSDEVGTTPTGGTVKAPVAR